MKAASVLGISVSNPLKGGLRCPTTILQQLLLRDLGASSMYSRTQPKSAMSSGKEERLSLSLMVVSYTTIRFSTLIRMDHVSLRRMPLDNLKHRCIILMVSLSIQMLFRSLCYPVASKGSLAFT